MKKKESPFIKVKRCLFDSQEMAQLMAEEGATGAGTYILIACHLSKCDKGTGTMNAIRQIAAQCHKSMAYVRHIICDYNLFVIEGNTFYCPMVRISLNIEYTLDSDSKRNESTSKVDSFHPHLINARASGGTKENEDEDENEDKSGSELPQKKTITTTTTTDFHTVVERIFADEKWSELQERQQGIRIHSDKAVRDFVRRQFVEEIEMNGCHDDGEPFTVARAKRYFTNWVRPGKPPRTELNMKINAMLRGQEVQARKKREDKPFDGFGTIDREGRRRGPHGEVVPMDAPPCMDIMMTWNGREWE